MEVNAGGNLGLNSLLSARKQIEELLPSPSMVFASAGFVGGERGKLLDWNTLVQETTMTFTSP